MFVFLTSHVRTLPSFPAVTMLFVLKGSAATALIRSVCAAGTRDKSFKVSFSRTTIDLSYEAVTSLDLSAVKTMPVIEKLLDPIFFLFYLIFGLGF